VVRRQEMRWILVPAGTVRGPSLIGSAATFLSLASSLPAACAFANADTGSPAENDPEYAGPILRMVQAAATTDGGLPVGEKSPDRAGELRRR